MRPSGKKLVPLLVVVGLLLAAGLLLLKKTPPSGEASPETAETFCETLPGPASTEKLDRLIHEYCFEQAEREARELLALATAEHGADSIEAADLLDRLVETLWRNDHADEAVTLGQRAVEIKQRVLGPDHDGVARSLIRRAEALHRAGKKDDARSALESARAICEANDRSDMAECTRAMHDLAAVLAGAGEMPEAKQLFEEVLTIRREGGPSPQLAATLHQLGLWHYRAAYYGVAADYWKEARDIWGVVYRPDHPRFGYIDHAYAVRLEILGEYLDALDYAEAAVRSRTASLGREHNDTLSSMNTLAFIRAETGSLDEARGLFEEVLAIRERTGASPLRVATSLQNFAWACLASRLTEQARAPQQRAVAIRERELGAHQDTATSLVHLALLEEAESNFGEARSLIERALAMQESVFTDNPDHNDIASSLHHLARLDVRDGDPATARRRLLRALAIRRVTLGPDHPQVARTLQSLAELDYLMQDWNSSLDNALEAQQISTARLIDVVGGLSEKDALRYKTVQQSGLDVALSVVASDDAPRDGAFDVWRAVVVSRGAILDEMVSRRRSYGGSPEVQRARKELDTERERHANLRYRAPSRRAEIDEAAAAVERLQDRLARLDDRLFRERRARREISARDIAANIPRGSALVSYVRFNRLLDTAATEGRSVVRKEPAYVAFVMRPEARDPVVVSLGAAERIDAQVALWRTEVGDGSGSLPAYLRAGSALRQILWDPVAPHLADVERVIVVPDGSVNTVSFATLPTGGGRYLVESELTIHLASAERSLVPVSTRQQAGQGLLAMGGPDYSAAAEGPSSGTQAQAEGAPIFRGGTSHCDEFESHHFQYLDGAKNEIDSVFNLFQGAAQGSGRRGADARFVGAAASETEFKLSAPGKRMIHVATHGFFLGDCPSVLDDTDSGERVNRNGAPTPAGVTGENPLLLSGLALAGANQRLDVASDAEDGILTAEEVGAMDLSGVEWAVLSACETGLGTIRPGEGVFGLRRAFEVAGVKTLITSLWKVDDEATQAWMEKLYEGRLQRRLFTDVALRTASREILQQQRARNETTHPFFWGAFVATGDWH